MGFEAIYAAEFDHVWRALRRFGVAPAHVEDAAQEVFVVVHRRLDSFDPSRPIRPWLTGIAFKVAADHRGKAVIRREVADDTLDPIDESPGADQLVDKKRAQDLVHRALLALDDDKRLVFVMHDLDGHSMPEIAAATGVPLNTLYSRLRLGRERFTKAVTELRNKGAS